VIRVTTAEEAQAREREREQRRWRRRRREERGKWKERQQQQQNNKPQKRAVRKMSLSGMTAVGRLGASFGTRTNKDKGITSMSSLPEVVRRGSHNTPMHEVEQDLPLERTPGHLAIGASPRFNS